MSTATATKPTDTAPAKAEPKNPTVIVGNLVRAQLEKKALHLPDDYSAENALKEAWLILQTVQNMDRKPALQVCTQESIVNALFDMVVQGLNPMKKQCYFIVYGSALTCQRSYFGEQALAKRLNPDIELYAEVIYEGDTIKTKKLRTRRGLVTTISEHEQPFPRKSKTIIGAYCGAVDAETGEDLGIVLMDMDRIKKSWGMSKTYKTDGNGTHNNFPDEMAKRTVIRAYCKPLINSSSDQLLMEAVRRQNIDAIDAEVGEEAASVGNGEMLSLPSAAVTDQVPTAAPQSAVVQTQPAPAAPAQSTLEADDDEGPGY